MRHYTTIAAGLTATALLTAGVAAAQSAPDPMAALREAAPYDALHPGAAPAAADPSMTTATATNAAPATAVGAGAGAVADPMAAAQPQGGAAAEPAALAQAAPNPELGDLPDGPGAEETYYQCTACHSTAIIRQQRVTDARWDYLWQWMVDAQGMVEPDAETKDVILAYLKQQFSSER